MSFSNIQQLYNALTQNGYLDVQAKTLNLPSKNQLQSSDLTNLLANTAFFNAGTLAMTGVTAPSPTGSTIVISGVFQQSFLGQPNPGATAIFYLDNSGNAQLDHVVQFPATWTFSSSFSGLAKTQIDELAFSAPSFVVASIANSLPTNAAPLAAGLNFSGALNFASGPVQPLAWLWNSPNLILTGGVTLPGSDNIPVMTLATPYQATEISIGEVSLNAGVSASSQDNSGTAVVSVSLTGQLNLGTKISIAISATIPEDSSQEIQLQIGSSTQPLASLNDLAALVRGQSLSAIIPSQIPLGNNLVLQDFMVGVVPASKTITRVEMTIGLVDLDWTLVPNLVQFQDILVTFTIAFPVSNPKLFAAVNATFTITSSSQQLLAAGNQPLLLDAPQADPAVIAIGTVIPGLVFTGGLASGTIDVIGAVAHFFGTTSPFDETLNITELNFSIDVANKTYSLNATVDTSDVLDINLGNSLPIPPLQIENIKLALNRTPTGFGANLAATLEFLKNEWTVSAARSADANAGWTFSGMLNPNQELTIPDVVNSIIPASWGLTLPDDLQGPKITAFQASFSTAASTFSVSGTVAWTLTIVQGTLEFDVVASMALQSNRAKSSDPATYSGNLSADLKLNNIELQVQYAFAPNSSKFTFIFQAITAVYDNNQTKPSLTISFGNTTVGAILEFLIKLADPGASSKLSSPWDALNSISLNGLQIQIFFKTKSISISYPISLDLGFLTINKIGFTYSQLYGQGNIDLILDCKFLGQDYSGPNALSWNPTQSAPPATPGAGAALFDLQYLGLGQHVSLRNVSQLTTVTQVINALKNAVKPIGDPTSNPISQLPGLEFNSGSNWLLGAQFSIMGTFSMSLVFNDPDVYGLLIGLSGEKAGILAGLSFEILYRKVTDKIGVYHIDLKLPDAMRQLQFGQVSITLPVITVDIYTNGDFRFDFGFPTSPTDTSRCFQLQIFPFVGVGGFYFAKLSGATSSKVPKIDNGSFNPVIEAGIALFVGVGKTIQLGILSGGVSVTVNGIIQGVYASFEPTDKNVKSAPYFWLQGTIAIVGNVYATVDFGIIQANVSLTVYASVTLTVQVYEPILIQLQAGVTVSVSIKIIFIRISFHFSATISASFTIGSASTPPWHVVQGSGGGGQLAKASALRNARVAALRMSGPRTRPRLVALPRAMKVGAAAGSQDTVTLMFTPLITKAQASDLPGLTGSTDIVAISAMLFVDTAIDPGANSPAEAKLLAGAGANSGFNKLLKRLLQWSINTIGGQDTVVTLNELEELYKTLGKDSTFEDYFTYKSIGTFLSDNIIFQIDQRPTTTTVGAAFFPMIPELTLVTPNYKADFSGAPLVDDKYEQFIEQYFADLAVQFANSVERNPDDSQPQAPASAGADPVQESLPRWLFRRYFLMLSRGVVQAAIDFLNSYAYTVAAPDSESLDSIATQFDAVTLDYTSVQGDTLAIVAQKFSVTQPALMAANPGINWTPLAQGTALSIPIQVMVLYVTVGGDTLDSIAAHFGVTDSDVTMANPNVDFDKLTPGTELQIPVKVTAQSIVAANHSTTGLLRVWQTATAAARSLAAGAEQPVLSGIQYQVVSGDAIGGTGQTSIAQRFGITAPQLASNNLNVGGVFSPGASLSLGNIVYTTRTNDTLQSISTYFGLPVTSILADNPSPNIVLQSAQKLLIQNSKDETTSYTVAAGDTMESLVGSQDTTIPSLLLLNAAILVQSGQAVNLTGVTHTAAGTFTVPYVVTPGDTLAGILTRYFGADTPAGENLLQQCNPDITDWKNIPSPSTITFPVPDTIFSITQYYAVDVATFLTLNAANTNILAPRAVLTIPDISPAVASTDSFDSLSQRYDLTLEELATDLAATAGLFRDTIPEVGPAQITIPYVPAMKIDQLVSELGASDKINQSAAMTSRFMLHGLRIPEPQTTEVHARFMAGEHTLAESAQLQTFPVFALMGQEFPAPVSNSAGYTFTVNNPGGASWATLPDGKGGFSPSGTLAFPLSADEQTQISDFQATEFQPQNMTVQRLPLSAYVADQVALQKEIVWQAGELPPSSCFTTNGQISGQPTLWPLPDSLQTSVAAGPSAGTPYQLVISQPNQSGGYDITDANCYSFAATFEIQVSRVPVEGGDNPYLDGTYLVAGAAQLDSERLLDLWSYLAGGDTATPYLLYASDPSNPGSGGYVSDAINRTSSVLLKTNLSTLSNAAAPMSAAAALAAPNPAVFAASLQASDARTLIQLLWECSVVKTGGFYLTYETADGKSLPDRLFQSGNDATLTLAVVLGSQLSTPASLLQPFNNVAMLADNIDTSRSTLFARTVVALVGQNNISTLQQISGNYPAYTKLSLSPASLALANAATTNLLDPGASIAIPGKASIPVPAGATFKSMAAAQGITDIGSLGTANATNPILQSGALLQLIPGQLHIKATVPAGNTGFLLTRDNPEYNNTSDRAADTADPQSELNTLFNLLGFTISPNASFNGSGEGLPAGPAQQDQAGSDGLSTNGLADDDATWTYRQALKIYASAINNFMPACGALPVPTDNPYSGIQLVSSALPQVMLDLYFQELNGNRTASGAIPQLPVTVGYTDELLTVARWPSTSGAFAFTQVSNQPQLTAEWVFSAYKYMPSPSADYPETHNSSRADRERMQTAYFQTRMPDVGFSLATTMGSIPPSSASDLQMALTDYVSAAWLFLKTAADLPAVTRVTAGPQSTDTLGSISAIYDTDPGSVAEANSALGAGNLFGVGTNLTIPEYYRFRISDTFTTIIAGLGGGETLLALLATSNENLPMLAGTALLAQTRTVTINNSQQSLASVQAISDSQFAAVADLLGPDGKTVLVPGFANANSSAILTQGITLTLNGTTLSVNDNESLGDVATRFGDGATAADVCIANRFVQTFFANGDPLTLPNYLIQSDDTLLSIASKIGPATPVSGSDDQKAIQLLKDNQNVPNLYSPGTMLYYGTQSYAIQSADTLASIASQFSLTIQDLGTRNAITPLLQPEQTLRIPYLVDTSAVQYSTYRCQATDNFAGIAALYPSWANGVTDLAAFNALVPALFNTTKAITIGGTSITPKLTDTFTSLAAGFGLTVAVFAADIGGMGDVVRTGALLYAPAMQAKSGDTLGGIALRFNALAAEIADANASVYNLLASGQTVTVAGYQAQVLAGDTLTSLTSKINAARTADHLQPYVRPADIGAANPGLKLNACNLVSPVREAQVNYSIATDYSAAIRPVHVSLTMTRAQSLVDPEFTSATPVYTATASLTAIPFDQDLEPQDESTPVLSLQVFATDFEQAFPGFKLATGADQDYRGDAQRAACGQAAAMLDSAPADSSNDDNNKQLWAVNFGTNGPANARFNYNVQQGVQFYALPPLSTKLWASNGDLTLQTYKTGTGLSGTKTLQFHSIDVDGWASGFLTDMDKFLSPAFAAPIYAVDPANFTAVVRAKGDLADSIKQDLAVVLNNSATGNLGDAQQALYQQLLVELSSAYSVDTIVQYPFQISSPCSDAKVACRLSGKPLANTYSTPGTGTVNLSDVANALSVSVPYLAYVLQQMQFILNVNIQVTYGTGQPSYTVQNGDTLGTIAAFFKVDVTTLAATLQVLTAGQGLFRLSTVIGVTSIKHPLVTGDTFAAIASRYGTTVQTLLLANQTLANVFVPNSTVTLNGVSNPAPASGRPDDTAALFKLSIDDFGAALWSGDLNATAKYSLSTNGAVLMTLLVQPPVYSFTTGKVPLANGTGYGTYLFSVQDPELSRSVFLNLDYAITDMEYDILDVPNTGGYQSSSWLSFINPIQSAPTAALPNDGRFGLVEIPVPLRAYPSPYVVSQQAALAQNDTAALQDSSIFDWKYQFQIARQAAAQDSSTLTVILNAAGDAPPMHDQSASDRTALFQALAQYAFVSAALNSDLDLIQLAQPTPAQQAAAAAAIAAFATLAGKIRDHWKPIAKLALGSGITGDIYDFDLNTLVSAVTTGQFAYLQLSYDDGPADFLFTIGTQYATDLTSDNVSAVQPLFANAGYPLSNDAEISGTSSGPWTIVDDANLATYTAVLVAGSAITINRKYLWPTIYDASGEQPVQLKAEQLQSTMLYTYNHDISLPMALQFDFERLNIINKQNAWGGASVCRNAFLVEGRPTMDNFVYRAPEIYFPNKVTPRLVITEPINLRDQPGQPNDLPTALNTFLTGLFAAQANAQPHSIRQISASARYNFAVAKMASAATAGAGKKGSQAAPQITAGFPLTLVSQYNFDVTTDPAAFSAAFAAQIAIAAAQAGAPTNAGSYSCTLTVFSASSNSAGLNPTVQYENLYFDLEV